MKRCRAALVFLTLVAAGCSTKESAGDGLLPGQDVKVSGDQGPQPTGNATLSFVPKWGSTYKLQFDALWKMSIPGYDGDSTLVVLLCQPSDPTCKKPVVTHEVQVGEREAKTIQNSFGPKVTIKNLPAGNYQLMIVADSTTSRKLGFGWKDKFPTTETDWGGVVSETDMMLNDPADPPKTKYNPPPKAKDITLVDGQTLDLQDVILAHYHQRDISPTPKTENGLMVVATDLGVRVVDLSSHTVRVASTAGGTKYYDYQMVDGAGKAFPGTVCGMIGGPNKTVFVLFKTGTGGQAGFAVQFDPVNGVQLNSSKRILFPGGAQDAPCRGIYHENNSQKILWVTNLEGDATAAKEGLWYTTVQFSSNGDVTATYLDSTISKDNLFKAGFDQLAALGGTLYLGAVATEAPCSGKACVFKATFDATGKPTLVKPSPTTYAAMVGPGLKDGYTNANGAMSCVMEAPYAGLAIAKFHNGHNLLFLGGCLEVAVFDLDDSEKKLDFNDAGLGAPGLDATLFGQGFISFSLSPDAKTLWAVSLNKSVVHLYLEKETSGQRQSYNRWMILPLDLTQGTLPGISPDYNKENIDDYQGAPVGVGTYPCPAVDPGLDLDFAYLKKYIVKWAGGLTAATPTAIPVGPTIAVGGSTLWLRGSGTGTSGLANQGNLAVYSLAEAKVVLWPREGKRFYEVWMGSTDTNWGFDLTPENTDAIATRGLVYLPK